MTMTIEDLNVTVEVDGVFVWGCVRPDPSTWDKLARSCGLDVYPFATVDGILAATIAELEATNAGNAGLKARHTAYAAALREGRYVVKIDGVVTKAG